MNFSTRFREKVLQNIMREFYLIFWIFWIHSSSFLIVFNTYNYKTFYQMYYALFLFIKVCNLSIISNAMRAIPFTILFCISKHLKLQQYPIYCPYFFKYAWMPKSNNTSIREIRLIVPYKVNVHFRVKTRNSFRVFSEH